MNAATTCACGSGSAYAACCGRYLDHPEIAAPTAEALMRSRYVAYTLERFDYVAATWHATTRPADLRADADHGAPAPKWLGLDVKNHRQQDDEHATVEFVARYKLGGRAQRLHESSRFVREDGRWYYLDGQFAEK
jgi:SEC-C motif-containing protein